MREFGDFVGFIGIALIVLFYVFGVISGIRKEGGVAIWVWGFFLAFAAVMAVATTTGSYLLMVLGLIFLILALMPFGSL